MSACCLAVERPRPPPPPPTWQRVKVGRGVPGFEGCRAGHQGGQERCQQGARHVREQAAQGGGLAAPGPAAGAEAERAQRISGVDASGSGIRLRALAACRSAARAVGDSCLAASHRRARRTQPGGEGGGRGHLAPPTLRGAPGGTQPRWARALARSSHPGLGGEGCQNQQCCRKHRVLVVVVMQQQQKEGGGGGCARSRGTPCRRAAALAGAAG